MDITIDRNRMKQFHYNSSVWWDPNGPVAGLQKGVEFMFKYITEKLPTTNLKVLDAGCGGGLLAEPLTRCGFSVVGVDVCDSLIEVAKKHAELDSSLVNLTYLCEDLQQHSLGNEEKYDVVVLNFVLQHVKHHEVILNSCAKVLKPGGFMFITCAAKTFAAWARIIIGAQIIFRYIPTNAHNWHNFILAKDVQAILLEYNCVVNETKGLYYNVFKRHWDWCDNVDGGFYAMCIKKLDN